MPSRNIATDPVTGYLLVGSTHHTHWRNKFLESPDYRRYNYDHYNHEESFKDFDGWLFVVNQRVGGQSHIGEISGHWPEDVLNLKHHYSEKFLAFLDGQPPHFKLLWDNDEIRVFEVTSIPSDVN